MNKSENLFYVCLILKRGSMNVKHTSQIMSGYQFSWMCWRPLTKRMVIINIFNIQNVRKTTLDTLLSMFPWRCEGNSSMLRVLTFEREIPHGIQTLRTQKWNLFLLIISFSTPDSVGLIKSMQQYFFRYLFICIDKKNRCIEFLPREITKEISKNLF